MSHLRSPPHNSPPNGLSPRNPTLDGTTHGEWTKWWKVWWSKMIPIGSLAVLTLLLVSIAVLEYRTEVVARIRMPALLNVSNSSVISSSPPCEGKDDSFQKANIISFPRGVMHETSDLYLRSLSADPVAESRNAPSSQSLLAMPVGIKQKETVDKIIQKFPADKFVVMLFHYDGIVEQWDIFPWSKRVIHVAVVDQTKWWYAKRFLHPDVVAPYKYIFVWDEDIGVEHFDAVRYLKIVEKEGLEISQPALDPKVSEVHHQITARRAKSKVHRRIYKFKGNGLCFQNSTGPPCTGWVEMMVPVFSQLAWRCAWYMIQNDLVHAWGLDFKLGYCAQGDRSQKVGIVDDQYIVHYGIPSLGGVIDQNEAESDSAVTNPPLPLKKYSKPSSNTDQQERMRVRRRSYVELEIFRRRWNESAEQDKCWVDPY